MAVAGDFPMSGGIPVVGILPVPSKGVLGLSVEEFLLLTEDDVRSTISEVLVGSPCMALTCGSGSSRCAAGLDGLQPAAVQGKTAQGKVERAQAEGQGTAVRGGAAAARARGRHARICELQSRQHFLSTSIRISYFSQSNLLSTLVR